VQRRSSTRPERDRHAPDAESDHREAGCESLGVDGVDVAGTTTRELQHERTGQAYVSGSLERPRLKADRCPVDDELRDAVIQQDPMVFVFRLDQLGVHARAASTRPAMA